MKIKAALTTEYEGKPVEVDISIEFEPGEYVEVIKELPQVLKQLNKIGKGEDAKQ